MWFGLVIGAKPHLYFGLESGRKPRGPSWRWRDGQISEWRAERGLLFGSMVDDWEGTVLLQKVCLLCFVFIDYSARFPCISTYSEQLKQNSHFSYCAFVCISVFMCLYTSHFNKLTNKNKVDDWFANSSKTVELPHQCVVHLNLSVAPRLQPVSQD